MEEYKYLELKAELLVDGISATSDALKEVGKKYKEQNHGLFGWDFEDHVGTTLPDDFVLPDGTVVQFRINSRSPYQINVKENDLILSNGKGNICKVEWIPRPIYYDLETSNNNKMVKMLNNSDVGRIEYKDIEGSDQKALIIVGTSEGVLNAPKPKVTLYTWNTSENKFNETDYTEEYWKDQGREKRD